VNFWLTPVNVFSEADIQALLRRRISAEEYSSPRSLAVLFCTVALAFAVVVVEVSAPTLLLVLGIAMLLFF
jgi:hypothetical protein